MTRKPTYVRPELGKEEFVRHIFSQYAKDLGFEILNIQKAFPSVVRFALGLPGKALKDQVSIFLTPCRCEARDVMSNPPWEETFFSFPLYTPL